MEKARCNTELYSNLRGPLNNVKPSNFWGSHHFPPTTFVIIINWKCIWLFATLAEHFLDAAEGAED